VNTGVFGGLNVCRDRSDAAERLLLLEKNQAGLELRCPGPGQFDGATRATIFPIGFATYNRIARALDSGRAFRRGKITRHCDICGRNSTTESGLGRRGQVLRSCQRPTPKLHHARSAVIPVNASSGGGTRIHEVSRGHNPKKALGLGR